MKCSTCGNPATRLDLCHARRPVCDTHTGLGPQTDAAPKPPAPRRASAGTK